MRKLSEIKGEDAFCVLADILDPFMEISQDEKFVKLARKGDRMGCVKCLLKDHSKSLITVFAILCGEDVDTFEPSMTEIAKMTIELFNDPDLGLLFPSPETVTSSGSATENTEVKEKK